MRGFVSAFGKTCGAALVAGVAVLFAVPASAQSNDGDTVAKRSRAQVAQTRTSIVITPRRQRLSPSAKRHCEAWLQQEYRVSGTVIVPRQRCWWQ